MAYYRVKRICLYPGCGQSTYDRYCRLHPAGPKKKKRKRSKWHHLYTNQWKKERLAFLARHPFCAHCELEGFDVPATVVDHIKDHGGDLGLFWDVSNWMPLCHAHHNRKTNRFNGGYGNPKKGIKGD